VLVRDPGAGTFAAGLDIYILTTLNNPAGETLPGVASVLVNTALNDAVQVTLIDLPNLPGWVSELGPSYLPTSQNIYAASVPTGSPAPPISAYQIQASPGLGSGFWTIGSIASGAAPPTTCTARVTPGQLPTPNTEPVIDRDPGAGTFPAGRDVYVLQTYNNGLGETPAGPANSVLNTALNDAVQVTVAVPEDENNEPLFAIGTVGIYEADVPTGTPAPPPSAFSLVGYYAAGATPLITATAAGQNPPLTNTTGPSGNITADTTTGGANGGQGYRYGACTWVNANETQSGFTRASVVSCIIDEDGWELGVFNIPIGPSFTIGRILGFSVADSSQSGPFNWIGLINLTVPSQNVVYPAQTLVDSVLQSATAILDNVTTNGTFNFTDTYLIAENNMDDRLRVTTPPQGCRVDYLDSVQRLVVTGVPGFASGGYVSLGADFESFYGDTGPLPITTNGEICYGFTDKYKSIIFTLCGNSGFVVTPNAGDPSSWEVNRRWIGQGPCGFRAWDAVGDFIIFVHRSGVYRYDQSDPDMMTKEIPRMWSKINWAAASTIAVMIDEDTHTVRIQVPTGASTVPNEEFCLSYIEGWQNPIHFSTFSGKEISMDACRRWAFNDVCSFLCVRMNRTLPAGAPAYIDGPDWETVPDSAFGVSQMLWASSGPDGTVQARTPGIFSDNGAGIDDQYETMSGSLMQSTCKPEGFNLNATGNGTLFPFFIGARDMVTGNAQEKSRILPLRPVALTPDQNEGITRKCPPKINEYWRVRFTNGKIPGNFKSLKFMTMYIIPWSGGRDPGDR